VNDTNGDVVGSVAMARDVTARVERGPVSTSLETL
jgi:hypothetical protein